MNHHALLRSVQQNYPSSSESDRVAATMATLFFPDNTVLINFGYLRRMDLLKQLAKNPAWCGTVAIECQESSTFPDLEDLTQARSIFGEPLRPEGPVEHQLVEIYRQKLAAPGDPKHKNLGEAETVAIITNRSFEAIFVSDDRGAADLVSTRSPTDAPIRVITTWELLRVARRVQFIDEDTLWSYVQVLERYRRHQPPFPAARSREDFKKWLAG